MKKILITALILTNAFAINAKGIKTLQSHCNLLPMKDGAIAYKAQISDEKPSGTLLVTSPDAAVFSLTPGTVFFTGEVTDIYKASFKVVVVKYKMDSFVSYTNLSEVALIKGQAIQKGQVIGKASKNTKSGNNEIGITIYKNQNKNLLNDDSVLSFIKRADN